MVISTERTGVPAARLNHFFVISTDKMFVPASRLIHFLELVQENLMYRLRGRAT